MTKRLNRSSCFRHGDYHRENSYSVLDGGSDQPVRLVGWSLTSLFSTNAAISETKIRPFNSFLLFISIKMLTKRNPTIKNLNASNGRAMPFAIKLTIIKFCSLRYKSFVMLSWKGRTPCSECLRQWNLKKLIRLPNEQLKTSYTKNFRLSLHHGRSSQQLLSFCYMHCMAFSGTIMVSISSGKEYFCLLRPKGKKLLKL